MRATSAPQRHTHIGRRGIGVLPADISAERDCVCGMRHRRRPEAREGEAGGLSLALGRCCASVAIHLHQVSVSIRMLAARDLPLGRCARLAQQSIVYRHGLLLSPECGLGRAFG
jgi:hypothetical protein